MSTITIDIVGGQQFGATQDGTVFFVLDARGGGEYWTPAIEAKGALARHIQHALSHRDAPAQLTLDERNRVVAIERT